MCNEAVTARRGLSGMVLFVALLLVDTFFSHRAALNTLPLCSLQLKMNGWQGSFALGASYISLPWWCGQAVFGTLDRPVYWILPILYSIAGLGIAIVNDFKSIEVSGPNPVFSCNKKGASHSFPLPLARKRTKTPHRATASSGSTPSPSPLGSTAPPRSALAAYPSPSSVWRRTWGSLGRRITPWRCWRCCCHRFSSRRRCCCLTPWGMTLNFR